MIRSRCVQTGLRLKRDVLNMRKIFTDQPRGGFDDGRDARGRGGLRLTPRKGRPAHLDWSTGTGRPRVRVYCGAAIMSRSLDPGHVDHRYAIIS
eukprot:scaffold150543_cov39-Tisochrysis_lutea.AAC.3